MRMKNTELHCLYAFATVFVGEMVRWFYDLHESLPSNVICDYHGSNFMQNLYWTNLQTKEAKRLPAAQEAITETRQTPTN